MKEKLEQLQAEYDSLIARLTELASAEDRDEPAVGTVTRQLESTKADILRLQAAIRRQADEDTPHPGNARLLRTLPSTETGQRTNRMNRTANRLEELDDEAVAFDQYLRRGLADMDPGLRTLIEDRYQDVDQRALGTTSGAVGGYTVPEGFYRQLQESVIDFTDLRTAPVTKIKTATGNDLPVPAGDDSMNTGELVVENVAVSTTSTDPAFTQTVFRAWTWSSKIVRVSRQLLTDSGFDLDGWLTRKLGERIGRIQSQYLATGTGTGEPQGILTGVAVGATSLGTATIGYDDFVNLEHSIPRASRVRGHYLLSDNALAKARKIKDTDGLPIWASGMTSGVPSTINGHGYTVIEELADVTSGEEPIIFGDLSAYAIRDIQDAVVLRLSERFAEYNQIAFLIFTRMDARPLQDPGDHYRALTIL